MAQTRRIIRKTHPARYRGVDDQLWPLAIAFCVLGGFLAGTVLAYLRLDDPRWYANAWPWLIAIPLVISSSLVTLALTGNRFLRRTMQLALVLCVIFHIVLFIMAIETKVFHRVWTEVLATTQRQPEKKVVKVPDYASWQHDARQRARRDVEQPVETELPDPDVEPTPREEVQEEPTDVQVQPPRVPQKQRITRPDLVKRDRPNELVPRQRDQTSKLSRRPAVVPPNPTQSVRIPDQNRAPERRPSVAEPGASGVRGPQQQFEADRPSRPAATRPAEASQTPQVAKKSDRGGASPELASAASLRRSETRRGITPRADVQVGDQAAVARQSQPDAVQPNNTAAGKQQTRSPLAREQATLPIQEMAHDATTRRRSGQQPTPQQPTLAQTPRSAANQRVRVTSRPDLVTVADLPSRAAAAEADAKPLEPVERSRVDQRIAQPTSPSSTANTTPAQSAPQRTPAQHARRMSVAPSQPVTDTMSAALPGRRATSATAVGAVPQRLSPIGLEATSRNPAQAAPSGLAASGSGIPKSAAGNAAVQRRFPSTDIVGAASRYQAAQRQTARASQATRPSLHAQAAADQPVRRAMREAATPSSPIAAENLVRSAASLAPHTVEVAASSTALNKAQTGTAGRGASLNLGLADPSADSPATVASGSAQRAEATQNIPAGPALTPQAPALVRDGRAGQAQPNALLKATPLAPATLSGSRDPGTLNAHASAALTQAASDATRGTVTASKGTLEVDTGPTTRIAESGIGRSAGGGQPQRSPVTQAQPLPRTALGQAPIPSLAVDVVRPAAAAPASDGGGVTRFADVDSSPNASIDARPGAPDALSGGPVAAGGGTLVALSRSLALSNRRDSQASDGPAAEVALSQVPYEGRKAARDRQLELDTSVADLNAGNAADRNEREIPALTWLANVDVGELGKQVASDAVVGGPTNLSAEETPAAVERDEGGGFRGGRLAAPAETVQAATGPPLPGGGTDTTPRLALGPQLVANVRADSLEMAGAASSTGRREAEPRSTQGQMITHLATGLDAQRSDAQAGALAAEMAVDASQGTVPAAGPARRTEAGLAVVGPDMSHDATASPLEKQTPALLSPMSDFTAQVPGSAERSESSGDEQFEPSPIADAPSVGSMSRLEGAALPVEIEAVEGPGGLAREVTVEVGIADRRASEATDQVQLEAARFVRKRVGGTPEFNTTAAMPTEPFRRRTRRGQGVGDPAVGSGPETEAAIELGLVFLSRSQASDGRWTLDRHAARDGLPQMASDSAATGLSLLAFQGAGYNHMEHRYASVVGRGIDFLVQNQQTSGDLFVPMDAESNRVVALYSHSIAALALCEAYGMTQDSALREPAQKALDFIVQSQNPQRGGWRYTPRVSSDTSVTGWMMMALKSGELANLKVPDDTYAKIRDWLDRAQAAPSQPHLYCYNPLAPDTPEQRGGRRSSRTMTSVGLLMRLYSGWRRDNPNMAPPAQYLLDSPPAIGTISSPQRDTYYWYYATQVMFHMGGQYWGDWNRHLHPLLVGSQIREGDLEGSWDPRNPLPDRWAPLAGRLYVTTMNLLSLEVAYRHLPLYEDMAR